MFNYGDNYAVNIEGTTNFITGVWDNVAQMDAALLRQIEELWLHLIALKKENELLKSKIDK